MNKLAKKKYKKNAREVSLSVLGRVDGGAFADILLNAELPDLEPRERALATELVYGVLRWRVKIDWIINSFSKIKSRKLEREVLNALRLGVYQLLFLTKIPARAAINESVNLVGNKGRDKKKTGFVNAVLRRVSEGTVAFPVLKKEPEKYISIVFSHPEWMVRRWIKRLGVRGALALCQAGLALPTKTLRVNTEKNTREDLKKSLDKEGITTEECTYSPDGLVVVEGKNLENQGALDSRPSLNPKDKRFYIQDEASQLVSLLLSPTPGDCVLDACSAPGGKTTHLAALMKNEGILVALDKDQERLKRVSSLATRFGLGIIKTLRADLEDADNLKKAFEEAVKMGVSKEGFDSVLVDAPCSGLGVLGRTPDIKYSRKEEDVLRLAGVQARLLENLSKVVRPRGLLVYSVCTTEPEETVDVVEGFLKTNSDFILEDPSEYLPSSVLEFVTKDGFLITLPSGNSTANKKQMDAFFAVRLRRIR